MVGRKEGRDGEKKRGKGRGGEMKEGEEETLDRVFLPYLLCVRIEGRKAPLWLNHRNESSSATASAATQ